MEEEAEVSLKDEPVPVECIALIASCKESVCVCVCVCVCVTQAHMTICLPFFFGEGEWQRM